MPYHLMIGIRSIA